jgi:hypothetical protein
MAQLHVNVIYIEYSEKTGMSRRKWLSPSFQISKSKPRRQVHTRIALGRESVHEEEERLNSELILLNARLESCLQNPKQSHENTVSPEPRHALANSVDDYNGPPRIVADSSALGYRPSPETESGSRVPSSTVPVSLKYQGDRLSGSPDASRTQGSNGSYGANVAKHYERYLNPLRKRQLANSKAAHTASPANDQERDRDRERERDRDRDKGQSPSPNSSPTPIVTQTRTDSQSEEHAQMHGQGEDDGELEINLAGSNMLKLEDIRRQLEAEASHMASSQSALATAKLAALERNAAESQTENADLQARIEELQTALQQERAHNETLMHSWNQERVYKRQGLSTIG